MPTKKTTKKAPAQKVTKKKASAKSTKSKKDKGKVLVCANGQECFWTTDGEILSNLVELRDALNKMAEEVFAHHVTKEKNDFADWVEAILGDKELAQALRKAKKPASAHTTVVRRLRIYNI